MNPSWLRNYARDAVARPAAAEWPASVSVAPSTLSQTAGKEELAAENFERLRQERAAELAAAGRRREQAEFEAQTRSRDWLSRKRDDAIRLRQVRRLRMPPI